MGKRSGRCGPSWQTLAPTLRPKAPRVRVRVRVKVRVKVKVRVRVRVRVTVRVRVRVMVMVIVRVRAPTPRPKAPRVRSSTHYDLCDPNPDPQGLLVRLTSLLITLGGMFIFALMVGLVTDGISEYVDDLKKGKSRVLERDHTLILGWSDKVPPLVNELALANESEGEALTLTITLRSASA